MNKLFINLKSIPIQSFKFPGGEVSVRIDTTVVPSSISEYAFIDADIRSSDDLMELLMLTDAVRREFPEVELGLMMPYLPYARQDRVMVPGESLSIKVIASIINAQNYTWVKVWDAHSDVGVALLDRCVNVSQYELIKTVGSLNFPTPEDTVIVSPDAGAEKKIFAFAKELGFENVVRAGKVRDVSSGKITGTEVYVPEPALYKTDKDFLIVDDICDGGRTFIELAKKLRPMTTGKIKLLITHGIFSKGIEVFDGIIDEVLVINNIGGAVSTSSVVVRDLWLG
jgi:ribose-phosphate pyrophosphokinase